MEMETMQTNLEHLEIRKDVVLKSLIRKQKRIKELDALIFEYQQRRYRLLEKISGLKSEHSMLDREIFEIRHPKDAKQKLNELKKEYGDEMFAQAVAMLKEQKEKS
jgi:hypothetical protein